MSLNDLKKLKHKPTAVIIELPRREIGEQLLEWSDLQEQINDLKQEGVGVQFMFKNLFGFGNKKYILFT